MPTRLCGVASNFAAQKSVGTLSARRTLSVCSYVPLLRLHTLQEFERAIPPHEPMHRLVSAAEVRQLIKSREQLEQDIAEAGAADITAGWRQHGELRKRGKHKQTYCGCKTEDDGAELWIGCEQCLQWFHPECVGIDVQSTEEIERLARWYCSDCRSGRSEVVTGAVNSS
jgi:hypothetical protein